MAAGWLGPSALKGTWRIAATKKPWARGPPTARRYVRMISSPENGQTPPLLGGRPGCGENQRNQHVTTPYLPVSSAPG